ncbi:MAG TPA: response regulator [Thermoanaerobaculia bacterium]|nr:response regulator [Thermoanaerobaculia bacterium]
MTQIRKILLVEDSSNDAELTIEALSAHRLANEILHLRDGEEALDYLYGRGQFVGRPDGTPACVLLDLKMPKVDGFEVLEQMKSDPRLSSIPVVVLTSSREERDLLESYKLGVNGYVVKPVDFDAFQDAVHQIGGFWAVINEVPAGSLPLGSE